EQLRPQLGVFLLGLPEAVDALQDALSNLLPVRHLRHGQWLVGDRHVVEDGFLVYVHALDAILNDDCNLVGECWIVGEEVGNTERQDVAVTILMLQALAGEGGTARGAANQETAATHVGGRPYQVSDSLEPEHRVINEERNGVDSV